MLVAVGLEGSFTLVHLSLKREQGDDDGERDAEAPGELERFHHRAPARSATRTNQQRPMTVPAATTLQPSARRPEKSSHAASSALSQAIRFIWISIRYRSTERGSLVHYSETVTGCFESPRRLFCETAPLSAASVENPHKHRDLSCCQKNGSHHCRNIESDSLDHSGPLGRCVECVRERIRLYLLGVNTIVFENRARGRKRKSPAEAGLWRERSCLAAVDDRVADCCHNPAN